jgi:hypothetical protein
VQPVCRALDHSFRREAGLLKRAAQDRRIRGDMKAAKCSVEALESSDACVSIAATHTAGHDTLR